ncbi:MAG: hypothetical protein WCI73_10665, partial [Phycisphaerae bacterium]
NFVIFFFFIVVSINKIFHINFNYNILEELFKKKYFIVYYLNFFFLNNGKRAGWGKGFERSEGGGGGREGWK